MVGLSWAVGDPPLGSVRIEQGRKSGLAWHLRHLSLAASTVGKILHRVDKPR